MSSSYSEAFVNGLKTGKVLVRKIWPNANRPGQVNVQFMQRIKKPASERNAGSLVAIAQGLGEDAGFNLVSTIFSFSEKKVLQHFKSTTVDLYKLPKVMLASELFGREVNIWVEENTTKDEARPNMLSKVNPSTGEVLTYQGKEIYRHTGLCEGAPKRVFLEHDVVVATTSTVAGNATSPALEDDAPF